MGEELEPFVKESIRHDHRAGMSFMALARKYDLTPYKVKQVLAGAPNPSYRDLELLEEACDSWKLDIYIPLTKLDDRLREASHDEVLAALLDLEPAEKAVALEFIVQRRMNLLCESNQSPEVESHG